MPAGLSNVAVVRQGDTHGNGMVLKLTSTGGLEAFAIGVPQDWAASTGPTWAYLLPSDAPTLVDVGAAGSYDSLVRGLGHAGFRPDDVARVVITHGHSDHDGAALQLVQQTGAQVLAHELYAYLKDTDPVEHGSRGHNPIQREMRRVSTERLGHARSGPATPAGSWYGAQRRYAQDRRQLAVTPLREGDVIGPLRVLHTPGHTPDELCASADGVLFTGDHVLPEITPHPTMKGSLPLNGHAPPPGNYGTGEALYGLRRYLASLGRVAALGDDVTVLPAHRLYNRGKLNLVTPARAGEIFDSHARRLGDITRRIGSRPTSLEDVTQSIFSRRKLLGGNLYSALSEVVAHVELLEDTGDVTVTEDGRLRWGGSRNYRQMLSELRSAAD